MYRMSADPQSVTTLSPALPTTQPSDNYRTRDSELEVRPPQVSPRSVDIYSQYVARAHGNTCVASDKYDAYVNCQLGVFPVIGWEK